MNGLDESQKHAFGIIGGVAFGMHRRDLVKHAKALIAMGLVSTEGALFGHNRSSYCWELTDSGRALLSAMVKSQSYPLACRTEAGRAILSVEEV